MRRHLQRSVTTPEQYFPIVGHNCGLLQAIVGRKGESHYLYIISPVPAGCSFESSPIKQSLLDGRCRLGVCGHMSLGFSI